MSDEIEGYHLIQAACEKCGRFVRDRDVEPVAYYPAEGFYGEVVDGHSSHPHCGERVPVTIVYGRFVPLREGTKP